MLLGPLRDLGRRLHHAGHHASSVFELKMLLPAVRRLVRDANRQNEFDKKHIAPFDRRACRSRSSCSRGCTRNHQPIAASSGAGKRSRLKVGASGAPVNRNFQSMRSIKGPTTCRRVDLHPPAGNFLLERKVLSSSCRAVRSEMAGASGGIAAPAFVKGHPWRDEEIS